MKIICHLGKEIKEKPNQKIQKIILIEENYFDVVNLVGCVPFSLENCNKGLLDKVPF
jgi:hypothetical protein